jgi:osmotically-inducible protein OsmY
MALIVAVDHLNSKERPMKKHTQMWRSRFSKNWIVMAMAALLLISGASMSWAGSGSTGEVIDDSVITTKVKSSYVADSTVSALDISVETNQGVVALTGLVNTEVERQRAVQIARETSGVKQVDARNLIVKK